MFTLWFASLVNATLVHVRTLDKYVCTVCEELIIHGQEKEHYRFII